MNLPANIKSILERKIAESLERFTGAVVKDPEALIVYGEMDIGACISPDGDIFLESLNLGTDKGRTRDRSIKAQIMVLILGSKNIPELRNLLPEKPKDAEECTKCDSKGRLVMGQFKKLICFECSGLGWILPGDFSWP